MRQRDSLYSVCVCECVYLCVHETQGQLVLCVCVCVFVCA